MEQKRKRDSDDLQQQQQQQPPRSRRRRSLHLHNMSERTRRHRIAEKIATLQELIPNCNKTDKSSVLSEAIEYIKLLQHQVQMMFMYQSMTVPYYSMFFPMRPMMRMGYGTGMFSPAYGAGFPVVPPAVINPQGESGFLPLCQVQTVHTTQPNQETTSTGITSATPSTSATTLSHTLIESSSHSLPSIGSEFYHIPIVNQVPGPQGLTAIVDASPVPVVRPQSFSGSLADDIFGVDEGQKFHHDSPERK